METKESGRQIERKPKRTEKDEKERNKKDDRIHEITEQLSMLQTLIILSGKYGRKFLVWLLSYKMQNI